MKFCSMVLTLHRVRSLVAAGGLAVLASFAYADTISPTSYAADLGLGESVTVRKTVTVSTASTTALIDVMFLFDTTGSMGSPINNAKTSAVNILNNLNLLGNVASGNGFYNDPLFNGVLSNLTTTAATTIASINTLAAGVPGGGGDFAEQTYAGIVDSATRASWRTGSNRFIVVLGDATTKTPPSSAATIAALAAFDVSVIGLSFNSGVGFEADITAIGGTPFNGGTSPTTVANAINDAITGSLASYSTVTVDDLGGGLPNIDVSTVCVSSAAGGTCVGSDAVGTYDRSVERSFEFDVTFTRVGAGNAAFDTFGLVDRGIVATETDRFLVGDNTVPEPGTLLLVGVSLLGLTTLRRRSAA